ncbi:hypothetical protein ACJMK2_044117 [Sinanodonta woodiana]|uniref:DUF3456 domain-containing protein n=1 Tax=Sinanodonta woodiana TaxID=1069815 RepID=A0ABD3W0C0_SINWO
MDIQVFLVAFHILLYAHTTDGLSKDISCSVCRAVVDEVNYSISQVDPKKKIESGSFRVDSKGNQATKEKSYARSEYHLIDVFENVCNKFTNYGHKVLDTGKRTLVRIVSREGGVLSMKGLTVEATEQQKYKFACHSLLEDHEEDMISLFREGSSDMEDRICREIAGLCEEEDLKDPLPVADFESPDEFADTDDEETDDNDGNNEDNADDEDDADRDEL